MCYGLETARVDNEGWYQGSSEDLAASSSRDGVQVEVGGLSYRESGMGDVGAFGKPRVLSGGGLEI